MASVALRWVVATSGKKEVARRGAAELSASQGHGVAGKGEPFAPDCSAEPFGEG